MDVGEPATCRTPQHKTHRHHGLGELIGEHYARGEVDNVANAASEPFFPLGQYSHSVVFVT